MTEEGQNTEGQDTQQATGGSESGSESAISKAEYDRAIERARRFEATAADLEKQMEQYSGINPEKYKAVVEDYENLRKQQAQGNPEEIDKLVAEKEKELEERYSGKLSDTESELDRTRRELKELRVTSTVLGQAAERFNPDALELIKGHVERSTDWQDGQVVILDEKGEQRYSKANPREPMPISEFLDEVAVKYPSIVKADFKGGARPSGEKTTGYSQTGDLTAEQYAQMTPNERSQIKDAKTRGQLAKEAMRLGLV